MDIMDNTPKSFEEATEITRKRIEAEISELEYELKKIRLKGQGSQLGLKSGRWRWVSLRSILQKLIGLKRKSNVNVNENQKIQY
jgi:hypothetical protein